VNVAKRSRQVRLALLLVLFSALPLHLVQAQPASGAEVESLPAGDSLPIDLVKTDQEIQENQRNLEQTRMRLAELDGRVTDLATKEKASLTRIASLAEQVTLIRKYLRQLKEQSVARNREIAQTAQQMQNTTKELSARRQALARRLTGIYKYGRLNPLEALLSARSVGEVFRKTLYLRWVVRADQQLAAELSRLQDELAGQKARLVAAHSELERLQRERLDQQAKLDAALSTESAILSQVRTEREAAQTLQQQLTETAARLRELLAVLQRRKEQAQPSGTSGFETAKGKLPWPVRGKVIAQFGAQVHPRYKTRTTNLGIDIKAEPLAPVAAVAPGRVSYADQFMGYGNLVIVDHGSGFYTLYSNLEEMTPKVGADLAAGARIGKAGEYLHFEIRKDGKPVNPLDWLKP